MSLSEEYAFPTSDRQMFEDIWVESKDIKASITRLLDDAVTYYKTNTFRVESIIIVPIADRGGFDIYVITVR